MPGTTTRRTGMTIAWLGAVAATALNGVVIGYGAIWFQLFGDSTDAGDYRLSAGGYGAAAVVLALAVPAMLSHGGPRWLVLPTAVLSAVLGALAFGSAVRSVDAQGPRVGGGRGLGRHRRRALGAVDLGPRRPRVARSVPARSPRNRRRGVTALTPAAVDH